MLKYANLCTTLNQYVIYKDTYELFGLIKPTFIKHNKKL